MPCSTTRRWSSEWVTDNQGRPLLRERLRYDKLWDQKRGG